MWLLVFFLTPIVEMYLLFQVADVIDPLPTIALVMLTAVIGVALLKRQGLATLTRGMTRLDAGQLPAREMAEGLLLAVAGALLLTPGFITDTIGFALLTPPIRRAVAERMLGQVRVVHPGAPGTDTPRGGRAASPGAPGDVIEGEFERRN